MTTEDLERCELVVTGSLVAEWPDELPRTCCQLVQKAPESFNDIRCGLIVATSRTISEGGERPNIVNVRLRLQEAGRVGDAGGIGFIDTLSSNALSIELAELEAEPVWKSYQGRWLRGRLSEAVAALDKNPTEALEVLSGVRRTCEDLAAEPSLSSRLAFDSAKGAFEFEMPAPGAHDEIFRERYLTRGSTMQIAAETGVGKSVLVNQGSILWGNGLPFLGWEPTRPLRVLVVQRENDDGENAIINRGIAVGCNLTPERRTQADRNVRFCRYRGGLELIQLRYEFRRLLKTHKPDLLILDPLTGFHSGDMAPKDINAFFRGWLGPMIEEFNVGCIVVAHFAKPIAFERGPRFARGNQHAYAASGAADQANYCRAVVSLAATDDPAVFQLHYGKRGRRLPSRPEYIRHSSDPTKPFWSEVPASESPRNANTPESILRKLLDKIRRSGRVKKSAARGWFRDLVCTRDALAHAIDLGIETGQLVMEEEKSSRTRTHWLRRGPDASE